MRDFCTSTGRYTNYFCRGFQKFFDTCGVVVGDGGLWLRRQCLLLAQNNNTPATDWMALPLRALPHWIRANNEIIEERRRERERMQRRRR